MHGATGVSVPNLVAKASWEGGDSATVLRHQMVAASVWDRQIKHCLVTKANVQVSQIKNRIVEAWETLVLTYYVCKRFL